MITIIDNIVLGLREPACNIFQWSCTLFLRL